MQKQMIFVALLLMHVIYNSVQNYTYFLIVDYLHNVKTCIFLYHHVYPICPNVVTCIVGHVL